MTLSSVRNGIVTYLALLRDWGPEGRKVIDDSGLFWSEEQCQIVYASSTGREPDLSSAAFWEAKMGELHCGYQALKSEPLFYRPGIE